MILTQVYLHSGRETTSKAITIETLDPIEAEEEVASKLEEEDSLEVNLLQPRASTADCV